MKTSKHKPPAAPALTLPEIDALVAEIADHRLTCEGLRADIRARFRELDERLAPIRAAALPQIERLHAALAGVETSQRERERTVAEWAAPRKATDFQDPRSLKLHRGVIGFRLSPPKVSALKTWTLGLCALALKRHAWGRDFLHPAKIDHEAILRARAEFQARPDRLAAVGLQITQEDVFYIESTPESSAAFAREAR